MQDIDNKPLNSKQWQDSSDGWVKTMNESKARKEKKLKNFDFCSHDDFEWCEVCQYDSTGQKYNIEFEDFETQSHELYGDSMPDVEELEKIVDKELKKLKEFEIDNITEK